MTDSPIIAAIGFDEDTDEVVRASVDLALRLGEPVLPVHAIGVTDPAHSPAVDLADLVDGTAAHMLHLFEDDARAYPALRVEAPEVQVGSPADVLTRIATARDARLIVVGGGQRSAIGRVIARCVAERVASQTPIPVWVARGMAPAEVERIVVAVDLDEPGHGHVELAVDAAHAFRASLELVTVIAAEHAPRIGAATLERFGARAELAAALERALVRAQSRADALPVELDVHAGNTAAGVLESARNADLVVLGPGQHRHGGLGATSVKVMRNTWCSVLLVPDDRGLEHVSRAFARPEQAAASERGRATGQDRAVP